MESTQFDSVSEVISQEPGTEITETFEETISPDDLSGYVQEFKDMQIGAISFVSFVLGIVIGIIVFHILSRRWFA